MAAYTAIDNPELYFQCEIWTGNNTDDRAITFGGSEDMAPNLVWIKNRDAAYRNFLVDTVRGATKVLRADINSVESTEAASVKSFTSDGFTLGTDAAVNGTDKYVSWSWVESTTAGFDIITYTGNGSAQNIAHNLSAVPHFVMLFNRDATYEHFAWHKALADDNALKLSTSDATSTYSHGQIDETTDASNVVLAQATTVNNVSIDTNNYLLYVFAPKQGFSKFGSYWGNDSTDGTFVYCGFRPAYIMIKNITIADSWFIYDAKRMPTNHTRYTVKANEPDAEQSGTTNEMLDILSNGFKVRAAYGGTNDSSENYIFAAFAEAPLANSNGVPCNAR